MTDINPINTHATPDQALLDQFDAIAFVDWRQDVVNMVLQQYDVRQIAALPTFAAEHLLTMLKREEKGIRITVIPNMDYGHMSSRQRRKFTEKKMRVFQIEKMTKAELERMSVTDQFLFIQSRIPEGTMPSEITRWIE